MTKKSKKQYWCGLPVGRQLFHTIMISKWAKVSLTFNVFILFTKGSFTTNRPVGVKDGEMLHAREEIIMILMCMREREREEGKKRLDYVQLLGCRIKNPFNIKLITWVWLGCTKITGVMVVSQRRLMMFNASMSTLGIPKTLHRFTTKVSRITGIARAIS